MRHAIIWITILASFCSDTTIGGGGNSRDEQQTDDIMFQYSSYDDGDFDYKNNTTNETSYLRWQDDDPYFYYPIDDEIRQQIHAELTNNGTESKESRLAISIDPIAVTAVVCFSLAGTATSIFCACIALYSLKLSSLMRKYSSKGIFVEAQILTAEPDINNFIEKEDNEDKRGLIHIAESNGSDEHSVHMTVTAEDDETISYQRMDVAGSDDTEKSEETKEQEHTPRHSNTPHWKRRKHNAQSTLTSVESNKRGGNVIRSIKGMLRQKKTLRSEHQVTKAEKFQIRRNQVQKERIKRNQTFFATIEYQNAVVSDGSRIRKQLRVIGEDIIIAEDQDNQRKEFHVKLSLLPSHPMSGLAHGEVKRAHGCCRCIQFVLCMLLGGGLIASCMYATYFYAPFPLFLAYVVVLVIQVIFLHCFVSSSFDKVIAASYLEKGVMVSNEHVETGRNEKLYDVSFQA